MNYCKIKTDGNIETMPNPYRVVVSNPDETTKAALAELFGWIEMEYTTEPEYDTETQYTVYHWEEHDGKAVQVWEVKDIPEPEPTIEDRVDNLEDAVDGLVNGDTE